MEGHPGFIEETVMRKILLIPTLILGAFLGFLSLGANATPINVNLSGVCTPAAGQFKCTSGSSTYTNSGVTFMGWQLGNSGWANANLTLKLPINGNPSYETGLGVSCGTAPGPKCGQDEINATPPQYISVDISGITFTSLMLGVGSVDSDGGSGLPESTYIYGCNNANVSSCTDFTLLASYTGSNSARTDTFTFTAAQLSGFSFLYVTPLGTGGGPDANILLASLSYNTVTSVPEPAVLGMFGLGILLIGVFMGLRRRTH